MSNETSIVGGYVSVNASVDGLSDADVGTGSMIVRGSSRDISSFSTSSSRVNPSSEAGTIVEEYEWRVSVSLSRLFVSSIELTRW